MKSKRFFIIAIMACFAGFQANSQVAVNSSSNQTADSLSLKSIIEEIVRMHPTVKGAEEALNNADARIGLARTGYYPQVDITANVSNMGPVIKLNFPPFGTFQLYPENNYSASINYRQVIYDFGRTRQNIEIENESKLFGEKILEQVKQKMSLVAVNNFFTLTYLQEAVKIKDEELSTLNAHLKYVETMKSTGSATDYQILSTKVKISTVESQKVDLLTALRIQQTYLNSLLGLDDKNIPVVKKELDASGPVINQDSLLSFALRNRDEIQINEKKISIAQLRYDLTRALNRPILSFMATGGGKNGYLPNLDVVKANYVVGVGLNVPIFDGMKTRYNLQQARSSINSLNYENENTKRTITSELSEAEAYMNSAQQKVKQFELQLKQAEKAFSLAETSFSSGTITNLDLLDASTTVAESRLMLLKARIDFAASIYRLKAALGERLY